ncbi:hypothetical protein C2G38_2149885 [Gigaspora rosea]|uniref:RING-type domain-containing protein n=1 Tax=Gigaspora rosea TaxID=44941 RepID=A0A397TXA6_9GLOM|nr:hypothetical protein C2G38_2149885 [Gigaspora rosea]
MSNNKRAKYSNFQKTRDKMPKSKINHGPCSIYNCNKSSNDFRCLSNLAIRKASAKGNLRLYPYLQPGYQICSPHYTAIVENQLPEPTSAPAQAFIPTTLPVKPSIGDQIKQMTSVLYTKRHDNVILDPNEFDKMLKETDPNLTNFFADMCAILIPRDRSPYNKKEDRKKIVAILYLMAGIRNQHVNNFKLELALYLAESGITCDAINALSSAGVSVTHQTVYNYKKKIADEHPIRVKKYFDENKNNLCIYNLDDYHNIHENRRPDCTSLSSAVHLATCVAKSVEKSDPVPIIFNNKIEQLSIHFYDNAIEERKEERKMKGAMLVGVKEQQLHSMQDFLNALNIVFDYNKEIGHLDGNVAPIVADWPGQRYIRQAFTHFHKKNENSIPKEIVSVVPLLGPLHVALNTKEQVIMELLDNIVPVSLDIYALLFRSGSFDNYVETIFRIWTFALRWHRKNYNKAPLAFLSDLFYWEKIEHPMRKAIKKNLVQFNDYWVENMHSRIRATTSPKDAADNIQKQAYLLDFHKYSAFREMFSTTKHYPYSPRDLKFLTTKTCIFLISQFQEIYRKNEETNLVSSKIPSPLKRRKKKELPTSYNLPTLGEIDITSMPTGYSTLFPPLFNNCDHCYKILNINDQTIILICGHGFHLECYNSMEKKCRHCLNYYKKGIWKNVNAFLNGLNSEKNFDKDLDDDAQEDTEEDNNNSEETEIDQLNRQESLELDLLNRISEINSW